ncbi:MAG: hypothetical protein H7062_24390, partial [Candidatus Saccharimonas sp.]|nr:hypothetical protein [Planctomycetaceae bacterium]
MLYLCNIVRESRITAARPQKSEIGFLPADGFAFPIVGNQFVHDLFDTASIRRWFARKSLRRSAWIESESRRAVLQQLSFVVVARIEAHQHPTLASESSQSKYDSFGMSRVPSGLLEPGTTFLAIFVADQQQRDVVTVNFANRQDCLPGHLGFDL